MGWLLWWFGLMAKPWYIRDINVTIRTDIWTKNIHSLGFRDIREWVTPRRLILWSLGYTNLRFLELILVSNQLKKNCVACVFKTLCWTMRGALVYDNSLSPQPMQWLDSRCPLFMDFLATQQLIVGDEQVWHKKSQKASKALRVIFFCIS